MNIGIGFITGCMLGAEWLDDGEGERAFCIDLFFIRIFFE